MYDARLRFFLRFTKIKYLISLSTWSFLVFLFDALEIKLMAYWFSMPGWIPSLIHKYTFSDLHCIFFATQLNVIRGFHTFSIYMYWFVLICKVW